MDEMWNLGVDVGPFLGNIRTAVETVNSLDLARHPGLQAWIIDNMEAQIQLVRRRGPDIIHMSFLDFVRMCFMEPARRLPEPFRDRYPVCIRALVVMNKRTRTVHTSRMFHTEGISVLPFWFMDGDTVPEIKFIRQYMTESDRVIDEDVNESTLMWILRDLLDFLQNTLEDILPGVSVRLDNKVVDAKRQRVAGWCKPDILVYSGRLLIVFGEAKKGVNATIEDAKEDIMRKNRSVPEGKMRITIAINCNTIHWEIIEADGEQYTMVQENTRHFDRPSGIIPELIKLLAIIVKNIDKFQE